MDEIESFAERMRRLKARLGRRPRPREQSARGWQQLMKALERRSRGRGRVGPTEWSKLARQARERARTR